MAPRTVVPCHHDEHRGQPTERARRKISYPRRTLTPFDVQMALGGVRRWPWGLVCSSKFAADVMRSGRGAWVGSWCARQPWSADWAQTHLRQPASPWRAKRSGLSLVGAVTVWGSFAWPTESGDAGAPSAVAPCPCRSAGPPWPGCGHRQGQWWDRHCHCAEA